MVDMFDFSKEARQQKTVRRALESLHQEIEKNLESFFVMEQLGRLRFFSLDIVDGLLGKKNFEIGDAVRVYARAAVDYHATLKDFEEYEQWYTADLGRKTKENGLILHAKKEAAEAKFPGLEKMIIAAKEHVEKEMLRREIPVVSAFSQRPKYAERISRQQQPLHRPLG